MSPPGAVQPPVGRPDPAVAEVRLAVRSALRDLVPAGGGVPAGVVVTVACSGGADSLALAAAVAVEAPRLGMSAGAVTVDHGLQPGSVRRAGEVVDLLRRLGLEPVTSVAVEVTGPGGPEARARAARYRALDQVRTERGGWVALGHTLDDQAETVLLGLARGSGPRSLAGMSPADFPWLRPLLGVRAGTTRAACLAERVPVWDDPHNADPAFTRVRLRTEVLPLLEDVLHGGVAAALARTADQLRADGTAWDVVITELAADRLADADPPVEAFTDLPPALRRRLLRHWLLGSGAGALTSAHLVAVDALLVDWHGQGAVALPGGSEVLRASGRLHLRPGGGGPTGRVAPDPATAR